jgi:hypothetical protein
MGADGLVSRCQPVIKSAVVTMSIPASRTLTYRSASGNTPWKVSTSGLAAMMSSTDPVAITPFGASPAISPASRPTFSAV